MDQNSAEWLDEQKRVNKVITVINNKLAAFKGSTSSLKEDIIGLRKNFWEDVTVNIDEPDDVIETYASIKQQAELLSERERSHGQFYKTSKLLQRLKSSPYFGRFDFSEEEGPEESFYIGIGSLMDENDEDFLIYDWRAPVASLYYDYSPGHVSYRTPEEEISGEMTLKRQYVIREGNMEGMFNTGITIGDSLLQKILGSQATTYMKSIVATIQREQNSIIRFEKGSMLIVQGVAGSGKTSVAMQRIAYLLYRHRNQINADQILLFSPNQMFSTYVSSVLPELGEENMQQSTFHEYVKKRLDHEFTVETPFEQLEDKLVSRKKEGVSTEEMMIQFKSGREFKRLIDDYLSALSHTGMLFRNIKFRGQTLITSKEITTYFYQLDSSLALPNRVELVKEWLLHHLQKVEKEEVEKDWAEEEAALLRREDYMEAYESIQKKQFHGEETFDDTVQEERFLRALVVERKLAPLRRQIKRLRFVHLRKIYRQLFDESIKNYEVPTEWEAIRQSSKENLNQKYLPVEDQTPYLYLQDRIEGRKVNASIKYVFMDEAQDYTWFQFHYIQSMFPYAQFTLLGDYHQSIFAHNYGEDTILSPELHEEPPELFELMRSYRSTKQIVEFAKEMVDDGDKIEAFNRQGHLPEVHYTHTEKEHMQALRICAKRRLNEGYQTVAILCKTIEECRQVYNDIGRELQASLIYKETQPFQEGLVILPIYLAKGIEFESVLVFDASDNNFNRKEDRFLLYTACTRAMHVLDIFCKGRMSPFLRTISEDLYIKKTAVQL
ncbi:AAA family ATPase [Halobacillus salinarum]|uniref:AAA family ATPase n=1 Tax=Halobacillus salinarum TaxID=2932257 RepID=A0ABY4ELB5_9BACI|nr:RNA polymerase recycling motor HelD [Halobacillus salinarum]UOQ45195.1 AAA family ATPase [Halobacillus salinarum]